MDQVPEGTIICLLCRGTVNYLDNDNSLFFKHLKLEHSIHYDHKFVLAVNFFDEDSKRMVIQNFEETTERKRKEILMKEAEDTSDNESNMEESLMKSDGDGMANDSMDSVPELTIDESNDESELDLSKETVDLEVNKIKDKKFKCNLCEESFHLFSAFKQHKMTHTARSESRLGKHSCLICEATVSNSGNLSRHMKRKHPDVNPAELKKIRRKSDVDQKESSILTEKEEPTKNTLKEPPPLIKAENLSTKCFQCQVEFATSKQLTKHKSNTRHQIYPPQDGSEAQIKIENMEVAAAPDLKNFSSFGQHFLAGTTENSSPSIECKLCNKVFVTKKLLSRHNSKIHTVKPFSCEDCPKTFVDWLNLRRHMFQYHPSSLKKSAEAKGKTEEASNDTESAAPTDESLNERINKVLEDTDTLDNEPDLNKLISEVKQELKNVNETTGVEAVKDDSSDKSFNFQSILENAISTEPNEESFACKSCDKVFDAAFKLKRHKLTHTSEKPFACDKCDNRYNQKSNLKRHVHNFHKMEM